jgi:hypothetical protein
VAIDLAPNNAMASSGDTRMAVARVGRADAAALTTSAVYATSTTVRGLHPGDRLPIVNPTALHNRLSSSLPSSSSSSSSMAAPLSVLAKLVGPSRLVAAQVTECKLSEVFGASEPPEHGLQLWVMSDVRLAPAWPSDLNDKWRQDQQDAYSPGADYGTLADHSAATLFGVVRLTLYPTRRGAGAPQTIASLEQSLVAAAEQLRGTKRKAVAAGLTGSDDDDDEGAEDEDDDDGDDGDKKTSKPSKLKSDAARRAHRASAADRRQRQAGVKKTIKKKAKTTPPTSKPKKAAAKPQGSGFGEMEAAIGLAVGDWEADPAVLASLPATDVEEMSLD